MIVDRSGHRSHKNLYKDLDTCNVFNFADAYDQTSSTDGTVSRIVTSKFFYSFGNTKHTISNSSQSFKDCSMIQAWRKIKREKKQKN